MLDNKEIIWSVDREVREITEDEKLKQVEEQAEKNYAERIEDEKTKLQRLRRDRENADSRESWQNNPKEAKMIAGERTKAARSFAVPHDTVFNTRGKTNAFKTEDRRKRLERFLNKHTRVSTNEREAYLGALECFKGRDGSLTIKGVRKMNRLLRTGETGGDREIIRAVNQMKEKGIIKETKDIRKLVGRSAVRKMREAITRKAQPLVSIREKLANSPRPGMDSHGSSQSGMSRDASFPSRRP
jgi:hypothetical protein